MNGLAYGYLFFKVNDRFFFTYEKARHYKHKLKKSRNVIFAGYHILRGWEAFFIKGQI